MTQRWKKDPKLHSCPVEVTEDGQVKKKMLYDDLYIKEFLDSDPIRDWESIERCIELWNFCMDEIEADTDPFKVLDCGTKDGQFPEWLLKEEGVKEAVGIEIADSYVTYAINRGRPVEKGDVCNLQFPDNEFDVVFSHHLLGLVEDYFKAMAEMFRVIKPGGYFITLNDVPGNPRKHYSFVEDIKVINGFLERPELNPHNMIYYGPSQRYTGKANNELIIFMQKLEQKK